MESRVTVALAGLGIGVAIVAALSAMRAREAGQTVGQAVGDGAAGVVEGIGQSIGIPVTDEDQCTRDLAAGDYWAASFSCPAGRFITGVMGGG